MMKILESMPKFVWILLAIILSVVVLYLMFNPDIVKEIFSKNADTKKEEVTEVNLKGQLLLGNTPAKDGIQLKISEDSDSETKVRSEGKFAFKGLKTSMVQSVINIQIRCRDEYRELKRIDLTKYPIINGWIDLGEISVSKIPCTTEDYENLNETSDSSGVGNEGKEVISTYGEANPRPTLSPEKGDYTSLGANSPNNDPEKAGSTVPAVGPGQKDEVTNETILEDERIFLNIGDNFKIKDKDANFRIIKSSLSRNNADIVFNSPDYCEIRVDLIKKKLQDGREVIIWMSEDTFQRLNNTSFAYCIQEKWKIKVNLNGNSQKGFFIK